MTDEQKERKPPKRQKSLWRTLHSQPVMILLVLLLLVYLSFVLAESFGLEGRGGWLGETIAAATMVAGVIVIAFLVVGGALFLRHKLGGETRSTWEGLPEAETDDAEGKTEKE